MDSRVQVIRGVASPFILREFRVSLAAGSTSIARREGYGEDERKKGEAGGDDLARAPLVGMSRNVRIGSGGRTG